MSKVYSYLRFSAAKQAAGASAARQSEYARRWAEDQGMILDDTLSMRDEGLSAYHQKHIKNGALGIFLEAINTGKIPTGSVLIVEGLDRLSRAEPALAQAQLHQIISAGITVVTASDGKRYNRESQKSDPMSMIYSLLIMIRAHEESETKSKRVADSLRRKCEAWVAGKYRGKISCGADPSWVRWVDGRFELIPELAEAIRLAVSMFCEGNGALRILRELDSRRMQITGSRQLGNINQLLTAKQHLFLGDRIVTASGADYRLEGYYPALLTAEEHNRLVVATTQRKAAPHRFSTKGAIPSIVTGVGITVCGDCGGAIVARNAKHKDCKGEVHRRTVCLRCQAGLRSGSCAATWLENALFDFCSDQFNLDAITSPGGESAELLSERAQLVTRIADIDAKIAKLVDAALDGDLPQALIKRMHDMETELVQTKQREQQVAAELSAAKSGATVASAELWEQLRSASLNLDYDSRIKVRQLVRDTFSRIVVHYSGALPTTPERCVDVLLVAKNGARRLLTISRKSGGVVRGLERPKPQSTP